MDFEPSNHPRSDYENRRDERNNNYDDRHHEHQSHDEHHPRLDDRHPALACNKRNKILVFFVVLLALCSVGLAGYIAYDKLIAPEQTTCIETTTEESEDTTTATDEATNSTISDQSIYIADWGIKIEKPSDYYVSYLYDAISNNGTVYFWAAPATRQDTSASGYEVPLTNVDTLGALSRSTTSDYEACVTARDNGQDYTGLGYCQGEKVAEIDGYIYVYSSPQSTWSTNADELTEESEAVKAIQMMLESNISAI